MRLVSYEGKYMGTSEKSKVLQKITLNTRGGGNDFNKDGSFNTVLAIIDKAETNCCGGDLGTNSPNLFEEAARAKEEEERLAAEKAAQEEAERIAAEEAAIAKAEEEKIAAEEERKRQRRNKFTGIFKQMGRWASDLVSEEDKSER